MIRQRLGTTRQRLPTAREVDLLIDDLIADLERMRGVYRIVHDHAGRRPTDGRDIRSEAGDATALRRFVELMMLLHRSGQVVRARMPAVFAEVPELGKLGCSICGRPGPLRHGLCDGHRKAWDRAGRPDLEAFVADRRAGVGQRGTNGDRQARSA